MSEEARKLLEVSKSKIDQSLLKGHGETVSIVAYRKMLRLVNEHGPDGIKSAKFLPNWTEGESPKDLPTGYRMIFDINASPVVTEAYPAQKMFAGTMALQLREADLHSSMLSHTGLEVDHSEIVQRINSQINVNDQLGDSYAGVFDNKTRGDFDFVHEYWVITKGVDSRKNNALQQEIEKHEGQTVASLLVDTADIRQQTFSAQRSARAEQISNVCKAIGISISPDQVEQSKNLIDNVSVALNDGKDNSTAVLYNDAVELHNRTLSGLILSGSMRVGPELLRGDSNSMVRSNNLEVFPSTTGMTMPLWKAGTFLDFDKISKKSNTNACMWSSENEFHPLLARNAYRPSTPAWKRMGNDAGFRTSIPLTPVAVKLAFQN